MFERYRDADVAIEHFPNTGEVLGTPNAKMKELLGKGGSKLFTPWIALQDQESAKDE